MSNLRTTYDKFYAVTDDKFDQNEFNKNVIDENKLITKGIEVGHIFYFGDKYSKAMNASVDKDGKKEFVKMGSYGIGVSRLVAAIIEAKYDDKNEIMKWPINIAPYHCVILPQTNKNDKSNVEKSLNIYSYLKSKNIDAIVDDTDDGITAKIKKFNLIGIPYQIVIGKNSTDKKFEFAKVGEDLKFFSKDEIENKIKKDLKN